MAISSIPRSVGHNFVPEYQISAVPFNSKNSDGSRFVIKKATGKIVGTVAATDGDDDITVNLFKNVTDAFVLGTDITFGSSVTKDYTSQTEPIKFIFDETANQISIRMALKWWIAPTTSSIISAIQLNLTNIYLTELISSTSNADGLNNFTPGETFIIYNIYANSGIQHDDDTIIEYEQ